MLQQSLSNFSLPSILPASLAGLWPSGLSSWMPVAAGEAPAFVTDIAAVLLAGAFIAYVCFRLGVVPIVGFLVAGVVIGPHGLGLVKSLELVDACAELGIVLLLFTIGIEFSLEKLAKIKTLIFGGGLMQVGLVTVVVVGILAALDVPWKIGIYTGFLVALSSTAIVLKLLGDRGETNAPHGQIGLGFLIFQDLAIILMVLLVPMLASGSGDDGGAAGLMGLAWALAKAALLIVAVLVVARRLMPPMLEAVARTCSPELFLLTLIAVCIGTAYLTSLAGVSLSLGAFLAGLMVSESRFSEHALGEILPLQIVFSATFFVSVGMLLDLSFFFDQWMLVITVVAVVLVIKVVTTGAAALALGYSRSAAAASALLLAQVGEFSFVLERAGRELGLNPAGYAQGSQVFIASTVVLMVLTPALATLGTRLGARLESGSGPRPGAAESEDEALGHVPHLENHVLVAGYGAAARRLVRVLEGSGIPYLILTLSPTGANEAEDDGLPVLRGDYTRQRILEHAGVGRAKMMVVADDNPTTARAVVAVARSQNPTMRVLVRSRYMAEIEPLLEDGADRVVAEELESTIQLFTDVLTTYHIPSSEIVADKDILRRGGYAALRGGPNLPEAPPITCNLKEEGIDLRSVALRPGSIAAQANIGQLELESVRALKLKALIRDGEVMETPDPATPLHPGDVLELIGSAEAFAAATELFVQRDSSGGPKLAPPKPPPRVSYDLETSYSIPADRLKAAEGRCSQIDRVRTVTPSALGCEECLAHGKSWVHLRICMICGYVGCCDDSEGRHARAHFEATGHAIMRSLEPGEDWAWCFIEEIEI
ncbi:MAG: cation:proton antiporter [Acidobacteriota bacterium]